MEISSLDDIQKFEAKDFKEILKSNSKSTGGIRADLVSKVYALLMWHVLPSSSGENRNLLTDVQDLEQNKSDFKYEATIVRISALGWSSDLRNLPETNFIQLYDYLVVSREYRHIVLRGFSVLLLFPWNLGTHSLYYCFFLCLFWLSFSFLSSLSRSFLTLLHLKLPPICHLDRTCGGVNKGYNAWWEIQSRPHSIMVVAVLGHSDTHFDFCFDLVLSLFLISTWTALGFQFYFEMIFTLIMQ